MEYHRIGDLVLLTGDSTPEQNSVGMIIDKYEKVKSWGTLYVVKWLNPELDVQEYLYDNETIKKYKINLLAYDNIPIYSHSGSI